MLDSWFYEHISSTGSKSGVIEVSVETAKRIMADYQSPEPGKQRKIIKKQVARYADQMRRGKWVENAGGALLFDKAGFSRGGQHRLLAQIEAGIAVSYNIRWDQDEDEIAADNEGGTVWSAVDIAGGAYPNRYIRQAIATLLIVNDGEGGLIGNQVSWQPSRLDVASVVNDPRIVRAAEIGSAIRSAMPAVQGSALGAMYAVCANCNSDNGQYAPYFFEKLRTGAGMEAGDPIHTLRNMLIGVSFRNLLQKKYQTMYVTARAWNYHVRGEEIKKLQRYTPPTNAPIRVAGWRPFFSKEGK